MRAFWHDTWGCARGPVAGLAPQVRLVAGAGLLAACMIAPAETLPGASVAVVTALCWLGACQPPWRVMRATLLLGLVFLLPYFLLVPFFAPDASAPLRHRPYVIVLGLFLRGMCGLMVSVATITALRASDLREALVRLPVPAAVSAILVQIVHQTATLASETHRVSSALAVRGGTTGGLAAWKLLASLPRVWLPRIVERADRVAAAMELRGYCESLPQDHGRAPIGRRDILTLTLVLVALGVAVATLYTDLS